MKFIFMAGLMMNEIGIRILFTICSLGFYSVDKLFLEVFKIEPPSINIGGVPQKFTVIPALLMMLVNYLLKFFKTLIYPDRLSYIEHLDELYELKILIDDSKFEVVDKPPINEHEIEILKSLFLLPKFVINNPYGKLDDEKTFNEMQASHYKEVVEDKKKQENKYRQKKGIPFFEKFMSNWGTNIETMAKGTKDWLDQNQIKVINNAKEQQIVKKLFNNNFLNEDEFRSLAEWVEHLGSENFRLIPKDSAINKANSELEQANIKLRKQVKKRIKSLNKRDKAEREALEKLEKLGL